MSKTWNLLDRLPSAPEHKALAEAVGWHDAFDWPSLPASLDGSTFGVVAVEGARTIGMARVVGDGVKYFYIQDVAVDPGHQGQGIERALLERVLELIQRHAPATAFVALFATPAGDSLYRSVGFGGGDMEGLYQLVDL